MIQNGELYFCVDGGGSAAETGSSTSREERASLR